MASIKAHINRAFRHIGVLAEGVEISPESFADAMVSANDLLAMWSIDGLSVPVMIREDFNLSGETQTIGPGGDFDTAKPERVLFVIGRDSDGATKKISEANYERVYNASFYSGGETVMPAAYAYTDDGDYGTFHFSSIPPEGSSVHIGTNKPLDEITETLEEVMIPRGYALAFEYGLAELLMPDYGAGLENSLVPAKAKQFYDTAVLHAQSISFRPKNGCPRQFNGMNQRR